MPCARFQRIPNKGNLNFLLESLVITRIINVVEQNIADAGTKAATTRAKTSWGRKSKDFEKSGYAILMNMKT
jgi:hypothetical protein